MRPALMLAALPLAAGLAACGDKSDTGPERPAAAGQVLGGEISDAMLPLDTARSTSPVAPRATASREADAAPGAVAPTEASRPPLEPVTDVPAAPRPDQTLPPGPQPSE